jgi:hypothetical protein
MRDARRADDKDQRDRGEDKVHQELEILAWFKNGLFWVTQTTGMLPPSKGGFGAEVKKTERVGNRLRVNSRELKPREP